MSKRALHIGTTLSMRLEAITQTFGILAVRGAGKSNLAAVMAEEMYTARLPFVVIDPVGAWWGLRSSGDGKGEGLAIPIFGGRHADAPLERTGGQLIADLVVDHRMTCVLDVSEFSEGDKIRFLIDFAERLYKRNTEPLHLFLEEADDYAPQRPMREQARLLGAWQNIVRRGRSRGLGITMITQRSAVLNKDVLTQIETLFVLRTTSPQDRKAIEAWVAMQGGARDMLETLPKLASGEAWVWSPSWLQTFERVHVRRRWTFDSGATPKGGSSSKPATLADVDLSAIADQMAATVERHKLEDPKALRAELGRRESRIGELQRELERAKGQVTEKRVEVPVLSDNVADQLLRAVEKLAAAAVLVNGLVESTCEALHRAAAPQQLEGRLKLAQHARTMPQTKLAVREVSKPAPAIAPPAMRTRPAPASSSNGHSVELSKGELETLAAIAQTAGGASRALLTTMLGFKKSYRDLLLQKLRRAGLIEDGTEGRLVATSAGAAALPSDFEPLPSGDRLRAHWLTEGLLPAGERAVLELVCAEHPKAVARDAITDVTGFKKSYRDLVIQKLARRLLVSSGRDGVRASEALFG